jgi:CheY-like chemotaxis protein
MTHILLLEDNRETAAALQSMLEVLGHQVSAAAEGATGLKLLQSRPDIGLVLTDMMMPVLDGISVLLRMRQEHPGVPVIAMTARRDSSYLQTALTLGAAATLFKPFDLDQLRQTLAAIQAGAPS